MPQLDKYAFIGQIFWLVVFFFSVYFYVLNNILPNIFKILRLRQHKLNQFINSIKGYYNEEFLLIRSYHSNLNFLSRNFMVFFINLDKKYSAWLSKSKSMVE